MKWNVEWLLVLAPLLALGGFLFALLATVVRKQEIGRAFWVALSGITVAVGILAYLLVAPETKVEDIPTWKEWVENIGSALFTIGLAGLTVSFVLWIAPRSGTEGQEINR